MTPSARAADIAGEVRLELPADPASVKRAASVVEAMGGLSAEQRAGVQLVVSELVTNAVVHAGVRPGDTINLSLRRVGGHCRVEVDDGGRFSAAPPSGPPDQDRDVRLGIGLKLVGAVCENWEAQEGRVVAWIKVRQP